MTAPLFDVKNKLSEYVLIAQNQEAVEISKHGKPAAFLVNPDEYNNFVRQKSSAFFSSFEKWITEFPATEENALSKDDGLDVLHKKKFIGRENPFCE